METRQTMVLKQLDQPIEAAQCCLSASSFNDVNLSETTFDDVNLSSARIRNATLAGARIENANLAGLRIANADLRNASIVDCVVEGMTIEGIPVTEMIAVWRAASPAAGSAPKD